MDINRLLDSYKERVPWYYFRSICSKIDLPVGRGWNNTIPVLKKAIENDEELYKKVAKTYPFYQEHLLAGEKAIKIFKLDSVSAENILTFIDKVPYDKTPFLDNFPFLLEDQELDDIPYSVPYYVGRIDQTDGINLVFLTKKASIKRIPLNQLHEDPSVRRYLGDYDAVFGIKKQIHQCIDVVFISRDKELLEFRIDNLYKPPLEDLRKSFELLQLKFVKLIDRWGDYFKLDDPINLFPLIDKLYHSNEGRICELGFTTDEGSVKSERMRLKSTDLRAETYHRAGKSAVGHIVPYKIAIAWQREGAQNENVELMIPGSNRLLAKLNPTVEEAIISKCLNQDDYFYVFNKLNSFLRK